MIKERTTKKIPNHLKKYVVDQQYEKYTPINQAVWRYVMRQNKHFLKYKAHESYIGGLLKSGISIEKIPSVDEMNEALSPFDWGAANIDGFIPGVVFFDFQAHGILPIASDIRKLENIQYTPAPDIIHEAAGHAPILTEPRFSEYVKLFGEIGSKAIASREEHELFDAIRDYSNILEVGTATEEEIQQAKLRFEEKQNAIKEVSEAEKISRLYWWTVEYGMIGTPHEPKIYGAGLLSSVAEGRNSFNDDVKKLPFNLDTVVHTGFDITKPQPQLFVCESFDQLIDAVKQFAETMAFKKGGTEGLDKAHQSNRTATYEYSSGLQVTGTLSQIVKGEDGEAIYVKTEGPTALATNNIELKGHGKDWHHHGFGSPIGKLKDVLTPIEQLGIHELSSIGITVGENVKLEFESGITVSGVTKEIIRHNGNVVVISIDHCTVTLNDQILFQPQWGIYDMAVGERITSVFAGAADSETFFSDLEETQQPVLEKNDATLLERLYGEVRKLRESDFHSLEIGKQIPSIVKELDTYYGEDWLLRLEIIELLSSHNILPEIYAHVFDTLKNLQGKNEELHVLIERGLKLV
ncbi:aromatic amino acid hydroxylase [Bacillus timonensis]|nr:aromatic amino acid hydroxylase [Bacillus timonensis]